MEYTAFYVEEDNNQFSTSLKKISLPSLDENDIQIHVHYSSLNYKDALASSGVKGIVKSYPFVPGIDLAGEVINSNQSKQFKNGDLVVATGFGIGMTKNGGFGEVVNIPENWILKLPNNLSLLEAMSYGTAGLIAAACVKKILNSLNSEKPSIVSGATGGVGSISLQILSKIGTEIHAITGKNNASNILKKMGADEIIDRTKFLKKIKPLDKSLYSCGIDTVGGDILVKIISLIHQRGSVACCGNVADNDFTSSVFPFILRGVSLHGVDSAESPLELKKELWDLLSTKWKIDLSNYVKIVTLNQLNKEIKKILNGEQIGRVVIKHGD